MIKSYAKHLQNERDGVTRNIEFAQILGDRMPRTVQTSARYKVPATAPIDPINHRFHSASEDLPAMSRPSSTPPSFSILESDHSRIGDNPLYRLPIQDATTGRTFVAGGQALKDLREAEVSSQSSVGRSSWPHGIAPEPHTSQMQHNAPATGIAWTDNDLDYDAEITKLLSRIPSPSEDTMHYTTAPPSLRTVQDYANALASRPAQPSHFIDLDGEDYRYSAQTPSIRVNDIVRADHDLIAGSSSSATGRAEPEQARSKKPRPQYYIID